MEVTGQTAVPRLETDEQIQRITTSGTEIHKQKPAWDPVPGEEYPKLQLTSCWRLSVDKSVTNSVGIRVVMDVFI